MVLSVSFHEIEEGVIKDTKLRGGESSQKVAKTPLLIVDYFFLSHTIKSGKARKYPQRAL